MTLVEVAVAVLLVTLLLAGLFATLTTARVAEVSTREREAASRAMFQELDVLAAIPFEELQVGSNLTSYAFPVLYPSPQGTEIALLPAQATTFPLNLDDPGTTVDESRHAGHVTIARDPDGDGSVDLHEVRLTVAWRGEDGSDRRLSVTTRRVRQ